MVQKKKSKHGCGDDDGADGGGWVACGDRAIALCDLLPVALFLDHNDAASRGRIDADAQQAFAKLSLDSKPL